MGRLRTRQRPPLTAHDGLGFLRTTQQGTNPPCVTRSGASGTDRRRHLWPIGIGARWLLRWSMPHDHHGTYSIGDAVLADRAQQGTGERSMSTVTDNEQVRVPRGSDEY